MADACAIVQERKRIRRKLREGRPVSKEDLALLDGAFVARGPRRRMLGHDIAPRTEVAAIQRELHPILRRYEKQIRDCPDLSESVTMAAAWISVLLHGRSVKPMERALRHLNALVAKQTPGGRADDNTRCQQGVLAEIAAVLERGTEGCRP